MIVFFYFSLIKFVYKNIVEFLLKFLLINFFDKARDGFPQKVCNKRILKIENFQFFIIF